MPRCSGAMLKGTAAVSEGGVRLRLRSLGPWFVEGAGSFSLGFTQILGCSSFMGTSRIL